MSRDFKQNYFKIKSQLTELFQPTDVIENADKLTHTIFQLYDELIFHYELNTYLIKNGIYVSFVKSSFMNIQKDDDKIIIGISSSKLSTLIQHSSVDYIGVCMQFVQHMIIKFILLVYGNITNNILVFDCMYNKLFYQKYMQAIYDMITVKSNQNSDEETVKDESDKDEQKSDKDDEETEKDESDKDDEHDKDDDNETTNIVGNYLLYHNNSCYLDTLLTIIFMNSCSWWRQMIFDQDTQSTDYSNVEITVCQKDSLIYTNKISINIYATEVQDTIRILYESLSSNSTKCASLRDTIFKCLPDIKRGNYYIPYAPSNIYQLFAELFPNLQLDVVYSDNDVHKISSMIDITDYVSIPTIGSGIVWELFDVPTFVIRNDSRIEDLTQEGVEEGTVKIRTLGEYILNGKYRLCGVVLLQGYNRNLNTSGVHYVGYLRNGDVWYYYNDMGPQFRQSELPDVFKTRGGLKPNMFFYERI